MKKIYCDICGKEINESEEVWSVLLKPQEVPLLASVRLNSKVPPNLHFRSPMEDICRRCVTVIHSCITMMDEVGWEPDFHEVLDHGSMWNREKAANRLNQLEEIYHRRIMT